MSAQRSVLIADVVVAVPYLLSYLYGDRSSEFLYVVPRLLPSVLAFAASTIAGLGLVKNGVRKGDRWTWIWLSATLAMSLVFLGELTNGFYSLVLRVPIPVPSAADGFFLAAYPIFFLGFIILMWPFRAALSPRKVAPGFVAVLVAIVALTLIRHYIPGQRAFETVIVSLAYPFLDLLLILVAVPAFLIFMKGTLWKAARLIIFGTILLLVGNIFFDLALLNGTHPSPSDPFQLFFLWAYLAFALGFYVRLAEPWVR